MDGFTFGFQAVTGGIVALLAIVALVFVVALAWAFRDILLGLVGLAILAAVLIGVVGAFIGDPGGMLLITVPIVVIGYGYWLGNDRDRWYRAGQAVRRLAFWRPRP
ncbi:hypothetical protein [uncultured Phenylobacterium sp.]|uniref:hypothetical protein n=1 Tax=uncultured Phenylobacterium sp. TaxID=349273 RepID=UPI0025D2DCEF|nr:hypothetical protein [uncultured Phenylobacterium sp.]